MLVWSVPAPAATGLARAKTGLGAHFCEAHAEGFEPGARGVGALLEISQCIGGRVGAQLSVGCLGASGTTAGRAGGRPSARSAGPGWGLRLWRGNFIGP